MSEEMSAEARRAARFGITATTTAAPSTSAAPSTTSAASSSSHHQHQSNDFYNNRRGAGAGANGDGGPYRRQGYGGHNNHRRDMTNPPPPPASSYHHHHHHHHRGGGAFPPPPPSHHHHFNQHSSSQHHHHNAPPPGSAAFNREHDRKRKPMSEYDETCAVRVGVLDARRAITEQDILSEIEQMKLASKIEAIFIEVLSDQDGSSSSKKEEEGEKNNKDEAAALIRAHEATKKMMRNEVIEGEPQLEPKSGKRIQWARVFMSNPDVADMVATEFAFPGAQFKWTLIVQRLPIIDHFGELIKDGTQGLNQQFVNNIYQPVQNCPIPQIIVVDSQEGYIPFMTTELFHTKGCQDYFFLKEQKNVLLRRSACKHYDPHAGSDCFYGVNCSFVHIHTAVMDRLLRVQSFKTALRVMGSRRPDDVLTTNWESERRNDTLVFRDVPEKIGLKELCFMFSGCEGYMNAILRYSPHDNRRHGIIRFSSRQDAFLAMSQTFGSGYNISFFGVLEDLRAIRIKEQLIEEEEEKKKRAQEKEERVALARERYERQQQQQGHEGGDKDSAAAGGGGYTSKRFGGGDNNNNSDGLPRESGQRRQRDHEAEQQKFQVERRDSDNDNDDNDNQAETNDDKNRYDGDDNNNDQQHHHSSPARSARSPSSAGARSSSSSYASSSSSSVGSSNSSGGGNDDGNDGGADKHRKIGMKAKASEKDFPELPEGWDWGFSRKTNQYYFYEKNKKNKTTFKHPTTSSGYRSGGEQY